jgi:transcriptional regulator
VTDSETELLQGTLDLLILKTLALEPMHGYGILLRIQQISEDVLRVRQGSLYPALYRLEQQKMISYQWGTSENGRRAKYYRLTRAGRKRLEKQTESWQRLSGAIARILQTT